MAAGDVYNAVGVSVANNAFLDFQPGSGVEVIVHNFSYGGAMELYYYDGTNSILVDSDPGAGSRLGFFLHCTNARYYRIKNVSGGAIHLAGDGMVSK
jgi:hypothetical protein